MRSRVRLKPPPAVLKPPVASVPKPPPPGIPPRLRRPRLVRNTSGGRLGDLFALFPDLPWAPRPLRQVHPRTLAMRMRPLQRIAARQKSDAISRAR
jgi:hypothetical protein